MTMVVAVVQNNCIGKMYEVHNYVDATEAARKLYKELTGGQKLVQRQETDFESGACIYVPLNLVKIPTIIQLASCEDTGNFI
jgi:hypothetical protein